MFWERLMKKFFGLKAAFGMLLVAGLMVGNASADVVVGITDMVMNPDDGNFSGTTNQSFQNWQGSTAGSGWYNGSGLASALNHGDTLPGTLPMHAFGQNVPGFESSRIRSGGILDPATTLTFELTSQTDLLNGVILWNHTEATGQTYRGFESVTASFSTDGGATFSGSETLNFAQGPATGTDGSFDVPGQLVSFGSTYDDVTHVQFSSLTKFTDKATAGDGADLYRMAEIRFTAAAVPEPSSLALLSVVGVGVVARRRKRTA